MRAAVLLLLLAFAGVALCDIWASCGNNATDHFLVESVKITPDPPVKGQNVTISVTGTLNEAVTAGNIALKVKYDNIVTVINKDEDLCNNEFNHECPVPKGAFSRTISESLPASTPSGTYTGVVNFTDQAKSMIACITIDFKLT